MEQLQILLQENQDKLIAQTFDGAKVMEGKDTLIQARVKNGYRRAHYTHCHQMQLIVKKGCEQIQESIDYFLISSVFINSVKDNKILKTMYRRKSANEIKYDVELIW